MRRFQGPRPVNSASMALSASGRPPRASRSATARICSGRVLGQARLAHEHAAAVAVDEAMARAAVAMRKLDAPLEHVGVVAGFVARRVGLGHAEQLAQFGDEELVVGALRARGVLPAGDEGVCVRGEVGRRLLGHRGIIGAPPKSGGRGLPGLVRLRRLCLVCPLGSRRAQRLQLLARVFVGLGLVQLHLGNEAARDALDRVAPLLAAA
jgi:hypothetical protein